MSKKESTVIPAPESSVSKKYDRIPNRIDFRDSMETIKKKLSKQSILTLQMLAKIIDNVLIEKK